MLESLRGNEDKVRIILNKADSITDRELLRVYGALMWSLSRCLRSPEVVRVYVSSFAAAPLRTDVNPAAAPLFAAEADELFADMRSLPARAVDRQISEMVKRVKTLTVHVRIVDAARRALPLVGRAKAQAKLVADLPALFRRVATEHGLPLGDFPNAARYGDILASMDLAALPKLKDKEARALEEVLSVDVPALVAHFDNPYRRRE